MDRQRQIETKSGGGMKPTMEQMQEAITRECDEIKGMLLAKNAAYGNSAADPVRIFSKVNAVEQINVRMDDKLSRIARGKAAGEDAEFDLLGYLILKRAIASLSKGTGS